MTALPTTTAILGPVEVRDLAEAIALRVNAGQSFRRAAAIETQALCREWQSNGLAESSWRQIVDAYDALS